MISQGLHPASLSDYCPAIGQICLKSPEGNFIRKLEKKKHPFEWDFKKDKKNLGVGPF
jgi:hypothetical protein